jgi:hypothetical protein
MDSKKMIITFHFQAVINQSVVVIELNIDCVEVSAQKKRLISVKLG